MIILFIEPAEFAWQKPCKIGNLFMNRLSIDEDAKSEILKICQLENSFKDLLWGRLSFEKGLDRINMKFLFENRNKTYEFSVEFCKINIKKSNFLI